MPCQSPVDVRGEKNTLKVSLRVITFSAATSRLRLVRSLFCFDCSSASQLNNFRFVISISERGNNIFSNKFR